MTSSKPRRESPESPSQEAERVGQRCDFCGDVVNAVRRVALDVEYDRLQKAHKELYSCHSCFEAKEKQRTGLPFRR